jgi:type IV secretion system protein TrbI
MTTADPAHAQPSAAPATLELRARPQPVTRINRKVLIGGAAVLLFVISAIVLVALKPPSLRVASPQELFNVDHKLIADELSKLPATYDGVRIDKLDTPTMAGSAASLPGAPISQSTAARGETSRLARMAGQARESDVFFRLQLKAQQRQGQTASLDPVPRPDAIPRPRASEGELALQSAMHSAERTKAIAGGEADTLANDPSDQARKLSFLQGAPEKEIYNSHGLQTAASPYQLMAGTIISASLISGLNSDLPGFVIAAVTENVFDTVSGRTLLIPQGSRLVGRYDNVVAFGQQRALVVWQRIIMPDGSSIVIDNLPATDTSGYAGLADQVDLHTWTLLKGIAIATVLGVGSQLALGSSNSDLVTALQQSIQSTTNRAGQRLVERNLNVQPTMTVRPGWPLRVIVHKDLVLRPYRGSSSP